MLYTLHTDISIQPTKPLVASVFGTFRLTLILTRQVVTPECLQNVSSFTQQPLQSQWSKELLKEWYKSKTSSCISSFFFSLVKYLLLVWYNLSRLNGDLEDIQKNKKFIKRSMLSEDFTAKSCKKLCLIQSNPCIKSRQKTPPANVLQIYEDFFVFLLKRCINILTLHPDTYRVHWQNVTLSRDLVSLLTQGLPKHKANMSPSEAPPHVSR